MLARFRNPDMKFSCDRCGKRFSLVKEPVPGRVYRIPCRCGNTIVFLVPAPTAPRPAAPPAARPRPALEVPSSRAALRVRGPAVALAGVLLVIAVVRLAPAPSSRRADAPTAIPAAELAPPVELAVQREAGTPSPRGEPIATTEAVGAVEQPRADRATAPLAARNARAEPRANGRRVTAAREARTRARAEPPRPAPEPAIPAWTPPLADLGPQPAAVERVARPPADRELPPAESPAMEALPQAPPASPSQPAAPAGAP